MMKRFKMFKIILYSALILCGFFPLLGVAEKSDYWYFKEFFMKSQPAEFFAIPEVQTAAYHRMDNDVSKPFLQYETLDNFDKPDSWTISFTKEMVSFENPYFSKERDPKESYLNWRTLDPQEEDFIYASIPNRFAIAKKNPIKTLLGVRSMFLVNGYHSIILSPKNPLFLNKGKKIYEITLFVLGLKKNYTMYLDIIDPYNDPKQIYIGSLNFEGWRELKVSLKDYHIPDNPLIVIQDSKPLELKHIEIISTSPETKGFFGTWLGQMRYAHEKKETVPTPGAPLYDQFSWKGATPVTGLTTPKKAQEE